MEPITTAILVAGLLGLVSGGAGGLGVGLTIGGKNKADAEVTVTDEARVEEQKTEQVFAYPDVVSMVCSPEYADTMGPEYAKDLCEQALCLADQRAESRADNDTCDRAGSMRAKMQAREYCDGAYPRSKPEDEAVLAAKLDKANDECLKFFVIEK